MTQPCEPLFLERQLCFSIYAASRLLVQAYQEFLGPKDLTYPQYLALLVLWEADGISVTTLGQKLALDSGTLSPLLKKLEAKSLVVRSRDLADERTVVLTLTPQAQKLKLKMAHIPEKIACLTKIPLGDLIKLKKNLDDFTKDLKRGQQTPVSKELPSHSRSQLSQKSSGEKKKVRRT